MSGSNGQNRLARIRADLDLTQAELASKAGVSVRTIARIEAGFEPSLRIASKVARSIGKSLDELFDLEVAS